MNLIEHAMMELDYLHIEDKEKDTYIRKFVSEFIEEFNKQEHSYMSAQIVINSFKHHMKDKIFLDKKLEEVIPNFDECDLVHILMKKLWELINTEEFVVYEIDEEWIKKVCTRLIDWKPISPLQGTADEWHKERDVHLDGTSHYQNKRYSSVFAEDANGKNAYNINGKVFIQNEISFTSSGSKVPVTFPYEVPDEREVVRLEDYVKVEDAPIYYIKYDREDDTDLIEKFTIGYKASTLDKTINNSKFWKADYCILYVHADKYIPIEDYVDMPIYRVRMDSRFKEYLKKQIKREFNKQSGISSAHIYEDEECTKEANLRL